MNRPSIFKTGQTYTFSQYFDLPFALEDILAEFDCRFLRQPIALPRQPFPDSIDALHHQLQRNLRWIELVNETARREALIAPILFEVVDITQCRLHIEYSIAVNDYLKGTVDYYIASHDLVIIEAKQSDLARGFTQLAIELLALDQWTQSNTSNLYGIVTTGEDWRFGLFDRQHRIIQQDPKRYLVPEELTDVVEILMGLLSR